MLPLQKTSNIHCQAAAMHSTPSLHASAHQAGAGLHRHAQLRPISVADEECRLTKLFISSWFITLHHVPAHTYCMSCSPATSPAPLAAALRIACSAYSPRSTVDFVIYKLAKRVNNPSWLVALKALMTFHRLLRECDASFAEQVWCQHYSSSSCADQHATKASC